MEKGAASPGRWQVTQCFCKIGATSFVNVGGGFPGSCPSAYPAEHAKAASSMDKYFMGSPTSRFGPRRTITVRNNEICRPTLDYSICRRVRRVIVAVEG